MAGKDLHSEKSKSDKDTRYYIEGIVYTFFVILTIDVLNRLANSIPNPAPIYLTVVVYIAFRGGLGPGLVSAGITLVYAMYFFSNRDHLFHYTPDNLKRVIVLFFTTPAITYMAGMLKQRSDKSLQVRDQVIEDLQRALGEIKTLRGILPICSGCKKIRDDEGAWTQMEEYIRKHTDSSFSHGLCSECATKLYPQYMPKEKNDTDKL